MDVRMNSSNFMAAVTSEDYPVTAIPCQDWFNKGGVRW